MLNACPICKSLSFSRVLCVFCATELHRRLDPIARDDRGLTIYSLFAWERDGFKGLSTWIYALKGREQERFWREPAIWALDVFGQPKAPVTFIPIPSSRRRNHARGFARALAHWSGGRMVEALSFSSGAEVAQKRLSRAARGRRSFQGQRPPGPLILVDDVVTTGATARAAQLALDGPISTSSSRPLRVWCLADRRPCGDTGALL